MKDKLNIFKYYGGKAKMADFISERLDRINCRVYIELFGGGGNVLLNKPRHEIEVYNEHDIGVYTLFSVLSDREKGRELIEMLREVSYDEATFLKAKVDRDRFDKSTKNTIGNKLHNFVFYFEHKYNHDMYKNMCKLQKEIDRMEKKLKEIREKTGGELGKTGEKIEADLQRINDKMEKAEKEVGGKHWELSKEEEEIAKALIEHKVTIDQKYEMGEDWEGTDLKTNSRENELKLAKTTFILYNMSRDGLGEDFSKLENGQQLFENKVQGLFDVIERLQGVVILNEDAFELLYDDMKKLKEAVRDKGVSLEGIQPKEIMMYLDPPYLEEYRVTMQKLEKQKIKELKEGIKNIKFDKDNPGDLYRSGYMGVASQMHLLSAIAKMETNVLISNYRDIHRVYDTFLRAEDGWSSIEYETCTTMGSKTSERTEVLWQNY